LRETRKVALGQVVLAGRESLVAIQPCGRGMLLETLRSADEVKAGAPLFAEIGAGPVDADQLGLARELIERKTAPFDPKRFTDHYEAALRELIRSKTEHRGTRRGAAGPEAPAGVVVDLMEALKRSLKDERRPAAAGRAGRKAS
jgi:DNA end-binding protein Ku